MRMGEMGLRQPRSWLLFFFFKQKTAYEIGLGIPAEPLFRSKEMTRKVSAEVDLVHQQTQNQRYGSSQIGRLITISTTPVIAGDSFEMDAVGALRLSPLRRGLAIDSTVDI